MAKIDAGILPVVENDKLVGMLTGEDIAIRGRASRSRLVCTRKRAMAACAAALIEIDVAAHGFVRRVLGGIAAHMNLAPHRR